MGDYQVFGIRDAEQWAGELDRIEDPVPDVHYRPEYCGLFAKQGEAQLFIYRERKASVYYPFIIRKINHIPGLAGILEQELYDITNSYGYGGPLAAGDAGETVWSNFYRCFAEYCRRQRIITEFVRFHPLLKNHQPMTEFMPVERVSAVVVVDLGQPEEVIWSGYGRNNRKNINKARREDLEVLIEESPQHFPDFMSVYRHTLTRNQAGEFYYFNDRFFEYIHKQLNGYYAYAHTSKEGRVISSELLLFNGTYLHSFLGGTLDQFYSCRPNNILKHEVINWAKGRGIKYFLLGGGRHDNDGIFHYKRSFAPDGVVDFYVGKKVHDGEAAAMLERLTTGNKPQEKEGFFPTYRRCYDGRY